MTDHPSSKLFDLQGKVAIVTGAARGNGLAIATGLVAAGVRVAMADILQEELKREAEALDGGRQRAIDVATDIRSLPQLKHLVERAKEAFGQVDILVNCAAITAGARTDDYDDELWQRVLETNTTAAFRLAKLVLPHMIAQKSGAIINITSAGAELGFPGDPAYLVSKAALRHLTRLLATDWAKYNIRVNNVCPGYFTTALTQKSWSDPVKRAQRSDRCMMRRWGDPQELVGPVIFLASAASSFMTGGDLYVDGGLVHTGLSDQGA